MILSSAQADIGFSFGGAMRLKKLLSVRPIAGKLRGSFIKDLFYGFVCL